MTRTSQPRAAAAGPVLDDEQRGVLAGARGEAPALALRVVVALARAVAADRLIRIESAHIDSCLYHGRAGLDFAQRLVALDGRVTVPTTLNVGALDLLHPDLVRGDEELRTAGRALMDAYVALGASPTWTCAPYQVGHRPAFGTHVAWAESNAIVFANSVLGARTDRYGDFLDVCAALSGWAPYAGLHRDEQRRGQVVLDLSELPPAVLADDLAAPVLGHLAGVRAGTRVPVFVGLPTTTGEDALKAIGAAAASAGGVGLFHAVGVTPEAPTLAAALQGGSPEETAAVTLADLRSTRDALTTATAKDGLDAVSVGTPHCSLSEFAALAALVRDGDAFRLPLYVSTSRGVLEEAERAGHVAVVRAAGGTVVVDTCTYVTPILRPGTRVVMTNSGKWAHYAPGNLGIDVVLGGLADCVASAREGRVARAHGTWPDL